MPETHHGGLDLISGFPSLVGVGFITSKESLLPPHSRAHFGSCTEVSPVWVTVPACDPNCQNSWLHWSTQTFLSSTDGALFYVRCFLNILCCVLTSAHILNIRIHEMHIYVYGKTYIHYQVILLFESNNTAP